MNKITDLEYGYTNKQLIFANEYVLNGCDKAEAAKRAGYSAGENDNYAVVGANLLKEPVIKSLISDITQRLEKRYELTTNKVGREMAYLAFFDIMEIVDDEGNVKDLKDIPPHARRVITGIEIESSYDKNGKLKGKVKRVKLASKEKCLEMLARIQGMFTDEIKLTGNVEHNHTHKVHSVDLEERIKQLTMEGVEEALPKTVEVIQVPVGPAETARDLDDALS